MPKKTMTAEEFQEALHKIFDHVVEVVGFEEIANRVQRVDELEAAIDQTIDEFTTEQEVPGTVLVALMNLTAERIVAMCIKEPPEVAAPVVSMEAVKNGLKMANEAMASFAASAVKAAEANGCTIAMRFRPKRQETPEGATETTPSAAPPAPGPLRDAEGATEGAPPTYDRDRDNPYREPTTETSFGGAKSGTEG